MNSNALGTRDEWRNRQARVAQDLLYRSLFEHALVEVHIWELVRDEHGAIRTWRLVDANAAALKSWGRNLYEIVGLTTDEIFPGANAVETFLPIVEEIMTTGVPKEWETRFAGTDQILHMTSIPVGEFFVSTGFDVSADRKREQDLQIALQSLVQATQAGGVGLWDWDLRTNAVRYSDEWKRQLGHEPDEVADTLDEWRVRVHPDDLEPTLARVSEMLETPGMRSTDTVFRMRHKDGAYRFILAQSSIIRSDDGQPLRMLGSHVDITERRRLEQRVNETQKLESIGTLAAGIAHDFNNLLGAIRGNLSLLRETSPSDPDAPVLLKELDDAARRATALTHQLLTFAKGGTPVRNVASVRELVVDSAVFVTRGSNIRCVFSIAEDLSAVEVDVGQLNQVINNLVINAMHAMPDGGIIRIAASNVVLEASNSVGLPGGRYVTISIADEGTGIEDDVLPRIFDPFFTTKSSGSGLGLSSSYAIINQHGGRITVHSTVGRGSTFELYLPATDAVPRTEAMPATTQGRGRILVMDDDDLLRSLFRRMLERLGYECDLSADGDEALRLYEQSLATDQRYDAVILDLTIPGNRGGTYVLPRLQAIDPNVRAVVTSGYADDDTLARYEEHGFRGRIQKPVDMATLSAELHRVLS